jgi:hypothetical protein
MNAAFDQASMDMGSHQTLRLYDAAGASVRVVKGAVWVTQDGDARDIVLRPGELFTLDRPGLAVLESLEASQLVIGAPAQPRRARPAVPTQSAAGSPSMRMPRRWYVGTSRLA